MRYLQLLCNAKGLLDGNVARSQTEYTFLHIHHLTLPQHLHYFANLLTKHKALFYFSRKGTVWIDLRVIDCNILVKLTQYAEVPIPTSMTMKQGRIALPFRGQDVPMDLNLPLVLT